MSAPGERGEAREMRNNVTVGLKDILKDVHLGTLAKGNCAGVMTCTYACAI